MGLKGGKTVIYFTLSLFLSALSLSLFSLSSCSLFNSSKKKSMFLGFFSPVFELTSGVGSSFWNTETITKKKKEKRKKISCSNPWLNPKSEPKHLNFWLFRLRCCYGRWEKRGDISGSRNGGKWGKEKKECCKSRKWKRNLEFQQELKRGIFFFLVFTMGEGFDPPLRFLWRHDSCIEENSKIQQYEGQQWGFIHFFSSKKEH